MAKTKKSGPQGVSRRQFLKASGVVVGGLAALHTAEGLGFEPVFASRALVPTSQLINPLENYPNRDWEQVYSDQYDYDSSFTWICSPNDTHECRLRAFVENGVVLGSEQNYDSGNLTDLYGNQATASWNPRGCGKGYTMHRRVYGPYRLKYPMIRKGWKEWADAGFPSLSDTTGLRDTYKFNSRGTDTFVKVSWDEAFDYVARAAKAIAETYSGADGRRRLEADGYQPEMIDETRGAGTRTMKFRGGMGLLGGHWEIWNVPLFQHDGHSRYPCSRSRALPVPWWPELVQLHLARRPGPRTALCPRSSSLRLRL